MAKTQVLMRVHLVETQEMCKRIHQQSCHRWNPVQSEIRDIWG